MYEVCGSIFRILDYHGATEHVPFSEISTVKTHFVKLWLSIGRFFIMFIL